MSTSSRPSSRIVSLSRRNLLSGTAAALAAGAVAGVAPAADAPQAPPARKVKIGLLGCGGRGLWISKLFQKHGGYEFAAVTDYFPKIAEGAGDALGVDKARRFSGLSGYKKMLDSGIEAVIIIDVPYFYPEQAKAAIDAGVHVYMAKPIAVDVPGCLLVGETANQATKKNRCFLVDYQLPHEPAMAEVASRLRENAIGKLAHLVSVGFGWQGWPDPPIGANIESRLTRQIWLSDTALSGDTIVSYDIHIIDGLLWLLGRRPTRACGIARTCRPEPHGDRVDCAGVVYQFDDGTLWTHTTQAITNNFDLKTLSASLFGLTATAHIEYGGKIYIRGGQKSYSGSSPSVYQDGAVRNIADFHKNIVEGIYTNTTVPRAVDGTLTAILGREAANRGCFLTMEQLVKENRRLEVNLGGLTA